MAISYNVYANDGRGGEVDYATPIAITADLTWTSGPLGAPSDNKFAVRALDASSGIEEANTEARVRVVIDGSGMDVTASPNGVVGLAGRPLAGGGSWVSWGYNSSGHGAPPSQFNVYLTPGPTPSLVTPAATVAYLPGVSGYGCTVSGLASNALTSISVRAVGPSGALAGPAATVAVDGRISPLADVDSLAAVATA